MKFFVTTDENVLGKYIVEADDENEIREIFDPGQSLLPTRQIEYLSYSVSIKKIEKAE